MEQNEKLEIECPFCSCQITIEKKAAAATTARDEEYWKSYEPGVKGSLNAP